MSPDKDPTTRINSGDLPPLEPTAEVPLRNRDDVEAQFQGLHESFQGPTARVPREHRDDKHEKPAFWTKGKMAVVGGVAVIATGVVGVVANGALGGDKKPTPKEQHHSLPLSQQFEDNVLGPNGTILNHVPLDANHDGISDKEQDLDGDSISDFGYYVDGKLPGLDKPGQTVELLPVNNDLSEEHIAFILDANPEILQDYPNAFNMIRNFDHTRAWAMYTFAKKYRDDKVDMYRLEGFMESNWRDLGLYGNDPGTN